jgi:hypothetical protein
MKSVGDVQKSDLQELKWTIRDVLSAGSDTVFAAILWTLILLANHPDWQRRLQDQVELNISAASEAEVYSLVDGAVILNTHAVLRALFTVSLLPMPGNFTTLLGYSHTEKHGTPFYGSIIYKVFV